MKKSLLMALSLALCAVLAIGGTLAYLTDTDEEINVFTMGNVKIDLVEEFDEENAFLNPGKEIEKQVWIENIGANEAWVWYTYAVPADLDNAAALTLQFDDEENWKEDTDKVIKNVLIDGVLYNVHTMLYNEKLAPNAKTTVSLKSVTLNDNVDYQDGEYCIVVNGAVTPIGELADKVNVIVNAYAIQTAEIDTVQDAYTYYNGQWGGAQSAGVAGDAEGFREAVADGGDVVVTDDIVLTGADPIDVTKDTTIYLNGNDLDATSNASRLFNVVNGAKLTINADGAEIDCGKFGLVNMTEGELIINGGTFTNAEGNDGAFLKVNGDAEMKITLNNVTYKAGTIDSGVLRTSGANVTVEVNGGEYEAGMGFILPANAKVTGAKITATNPANMWPAVYGAEGVVVEGCEIKSNCHAIAVGGGETMTVKNCNVIVPDGKLAFQVFSSGGTINVNECTWTGIYGTTGKMNAGRVAIINIDGVEKYRKG